MANKEEQKTTEKEENKKDREAKEQKNKTTGASESEEKTQKKDQESSSKDTKGQEKTQEKQENKKPKSSKTDKKKTESKVNAWNLPISTKQSVAICRFIKSKKIGDAIRDLQEVERGKRPVPMKGEIAHKKNTGDSKGKREKISSGKYPKRASSNIRNALNSLRANAENDGLEEPIIFVAKANLAHRPLTKFGRAQKKRTHINLVAREKQTNKQKNQTKK